MIKRFTLLNVVPTILGSAFLPSSLFQRASELWPFGSLVDPSDHELLALDGADRAGAPHLVHLRWESVPVYRNGKIASSRTTYSGIIYVGNPAQEFRVVFDTGSGHLVLPAVECQSESCLVHRTFNASASSTSQAIDIHGRKVSGNVTDRLSISYGTGTVLGEFMQEMVCLTKSLCTQMGIVVAIEMSTKPFKDFRFDGLLGLGFPSLAITGSYSFLHQFATRHPRSQPSFGIFLTDGEEGEESELAIGGYNVDRLLEPLSWIPVVGDAGFWQVEIKAFRINGVAHEVCNDGSCRGIVDSGTSHLGLPATWKDEIEELLKVDAGNLADCRSAESPVIEVELATTNLTIYSSTYMRKLPLMKGVTVGSSLQNVLSRSQLQPQVDTNNVETCAVEHSSNVSVQMDGYYCSPRVMHVNVPEVGQKLFVLGEPLMHRYYTVFDWKRKEIGFGLANNMRNR